MVLSRFPFAMKLKRLKSKGASRPLPRAVLAVVAVLVLLAAVMTYINRVEGTGKAPAAQERSEPALPIAPPQDRPVASQPSRD